MNISLDTNNKQDMRLMGAIITAQKNFSTTVKETGAPNFHRTSPALHRAIKPASQINDPPQDSLASALTITSKQAESLMGIAIPNIRRNCNEIPGYKSIIAPDPTETGRWILGEDPTSNMREQDLEVLRSGELLRVPRLLTTQVINQCIKSIDPQKPPKYRPWNSNNIVKTYACKGEDRLTYYVTLIDGFAVNRPRYHMAIENHFLKRTF
jgi:hypothetical protein